ncbi:hypothetical protein [Streptomyces sp. NBC_00091]|uniref:hypothetical protein n=1 Tax=Streptomyces sp. NBC_00091 TaxID=2975648 RepID=UPI00224D2DD0|nr:hypothetical protein [Streptomyces sp. NBC_00091]MCX5374963.1 hypothetical protein [Streptomyces sp. NBC_00091]
MSADGDRKARRAKLTLAGIAVVAAVLLAGGGYGAAVLLNDEGGSAAPASGAPAKGPSGAPSASASGAELSKTPETGPKLKLFKPTGHANGVATGFKHSGVDAVSAAVYWWEEYAWLDDQKARQQLEAVVSPDSADYIDQQISEVRKLREQAGLPPSGGTPSAITFTTSVQAVRYYALPVEGEKPGDVIEVWMSYDRYATGPDEKPDNNPLKGELTSVILRWQNGMWRITNRPNYVKHSSHPVSYFPESPYAWRDGWRQVQRAG